MGWKFYDANGVESIAQLGTVAITAGGTGAITAGAALTALGVGSGDSPTFTNLTLSGNLTVSGSTTTIDTTTLTVTDTLIKLNQGYVGAAYDVGLVFTQGNGSATDTANRGFIWDSNETEFSTIFCNTEPGTTVGNVTINDYADLHVGGLIADDTIELGHATDTTLSRAGAGDVNIQTNIIYRAGGTDVPVADGGTGLGSYAQGDIVYYDSGITLAKLNKPGTPAGEVLTFATGATAPSWVAASAGVGLGMVIALGG